MTAPAPDLEQRYQAMRRDLKLGGAPLRDRLPGCVRLADELRRAGKTQLALGLLETMETAGALDAGYHFTRALVHRAAQDLEAAYAAIRKAKHLAPANADIAFAAAQFSFETWRPSIAWFREARKLAPRNPALLRNYAIALAQEGRPQQADDLLSEQLARTPGWVDGQRQLASIRLTGGLGDADAGFEAACRAEPGNLAVRLAWFQFLCQGKDWDRAAEVLGGAGAASQDALPLRYSQIFLRAEAGAVLSEDDLAGPHTDRQDPGFDLCRTRYLLRMGDAARAEAIAAVHMDGPSANLFWPYLSLCWRLMGDARFDWLERGGAFISEIELLAPGKENSRLAAFIRTLHTLKQPYAEQSVRGGTQTGRSLLFHHSPEIQAFRERINSAAARYVAALPEVEPGHPLLGDRPETIRLTGSWSVALRDEGYHAAHTHVLGWLSSAYYLALPETDAMGPPPAGHLRLGDPPPELGLGLAPYRIVAPRVGKLVVFPSYTWHGTAPFRAGERLTVAFDVAPGGAVPD